MKKNDTYSDFSKTFQRMIEHCSKKGKYLASNRLYNGLSDIGDLYLKLYNNCISTHHNFQSVFERGKIHFDKGQIEECLVDMNSLINADLVNDLLKVIDPSDLLITKGQAFLEMGNYEKAIEALSKVIKKDPTNKAAYFHRAAGYFETGKFDEAIQDYLKSDKGKGIYTPTLKAPDNFTEAFNTNACQGAYESTIDFVPSCCHSAYGLSEALWAIHWSANPLNPETPENIKNFSNACYEMGECIVNYFKNMDADTIDGYVDQIKVPIYTLRSIK